MTNKTAIISVFFIVGLVACGLGNVAALVTGPLNIHFPTQENDSIIQTNETNYSISDTVSENSNVYEVSSDNSQDYSYADTNQTDSKDKKDSDSKGDDKGGGEDDPSHSGDKTKLSELI